MTQQSNLPALDYSLYAQALKHHSNPEVQAQYAHLEADFAKRHDAVDADDPHRLKKHDDLNTELTRSLTGLAVEHKLHQKLRQDHFGHGAAVQVPQHTGGSGMDPRAAARFAEIAKMRGETIAFRDLGELNPMHLESGFVPKPRHVHAKSQRPDDHELYTGLVFAHHDLAKDPPPGQNFNDVEADWRASMEKGFATTATLGELLGTSVRPAPSSLPRVNGGGVESLEADFPETRSQFQDRYKDHGTIRKQMTAFKGRLRQQHSKLSDQEFEAKLDGLRDRRVFIDRTSGMPFAGDADLLSAGSTHLDEQSHNAIHGIAPGEQSHFYDAYGSGDRMHGQYGTIRRGTMGTAMDLNIGAMETLGIHHELVKHGMEPHNPNPEPLKSAWFVDPQKVGPTFAGERLSGRELQAEMVGTQHHHGAEWGVGWMPEVATELHETFGLNPRVQANWAGDSGHDVDESTNQVTPASTAPRTSMPQIPAPPRRSAADGQKALQDIVARQRARSRAIRGQTDRTGSVGPPRKKTPGASVISDRGRRMPAKWHLEQLRQVQPRFSTVSGAQRGIFGSTLETPRPSPPRGLKSTRAASVPAKRRDYPTRR
ncbi:MAG: hypothetical protein AAGM22_29535 [Acidobacteriota bacterium]